MSCAKRVTPHSGVVETCRAGDELFYFAGVLPADARVSAHQRPPFLEGQRVPIALFAAAFRHVVETDDWPIGQCRVDPVLPIFLHPLAKIVHCGLKFRGGRLEFLLAGQGGCILFIARGVFAFLGEREVTVNRDRASAPNDSVSCFSIRFRSSKSGSDEHETEVRFGRYLAEGQQLRGGKRAYFLHQSGQGNLGVALLGWIEELPLAVFDR